MLKVGDKIPAFSVVDQDGKIITDKDLLGRKIVLYFYPKDNTSGCTAQACNLRDNLPALQERGYTIYGVSRDSVTSHVNFRSKHELPFDLLSDPTTTMLQAFDAWGEKKLYGKTVVGAIRKTFLIAPDGTIERIIERVDTKNHAEQILT
ncbi:MAG: thioredoxin-dependent thiol peroxidase [Rikenellaceae bacterium]|jgi:peroxiredoxin Q/BCP|nr:thioredoxin-dependent thiol peroxidase [Rikenellaceae bacterium]